MTNKIYLDNGSTSFPKPKEVAEAVYSFMTQTGSNINRGCYNDAYSVEEMVYETRQMLCDFFQGPSCKNVVFTKNVTESLNVILKGFLRPGDHILVSSMEHNAVMRPLTQLQEKGISFTRIPCNPDGTLCIEQIESLIQDNTVAIAMTHGSNVCGTVLPIKEVGEICHKHSLKFIVDCAQTAGVIPVQMKDMHIDALAFTGHKGLLGPQGIGGFLVTDEMVSLIEPLLSGGTGSISHTEDIPDFMPDRFEPGTLNLPGIAGLHSALKWLNKTGTRAILEHELLLTKRLIQGLLELDPAGNHIRILGVTDFPSSNHISISNVNRIGVVSIQTMQIDNAQVAYQLDEKYGIMTRVGLHCAPSAHKTLGTYPTGTIRFSFGWWNNNKDVDVALTALSEIRGSHNGI